MHFGGCFWGSYGMPRGCCPSVHIDSASTPCLSSEISHASCYGKAFIITKDDRSGTHANCIMMPPLNAPMGCPRAFACLCRSALHLSCELSLKIAMLLTAGPRLLPTRMMGISNRFRVYREAALHWQLPRVLSGAPGSVGVQGGQLTVTKAAPCDSKLSHSCMHCCLLFHLIECMHAFGCWKGPICPHFWT